MKEGALQRIFLPGSFFFFVKAEVILRRERSSFRRCRRTVMQSLLCQSSKVSAEQNFICLFVEKNLSYTGSHYLLCVLYTVSQVKQ